MHDIATGGFCGEKALGDVEECLAVEIPVTWLVRNGVDEVGDGLGGCMRNTEGCVRTEAKFLPKKKNEKCVSPSQNF
jgi:hypothetical protein